MKKIKYLRDNKIRLDGVKFKPYTVGNLPPSFGYLFKDQGTDEESEGISLWFNHKGLTYVVDNS